MPYQARLEKLMSFLDQSPSAFQACELIAERLEKVGFKKLSFAQTRHLKEGDKAYLSPNGSSIYAFVVGKNWQTTAPRLYGAHSDSPCLRIKPNPLVQKEGYHLLATEVYGGPILNTWFDRPLSVAGRVVLRSDDLFRPNVHSLVIDRPLFSIPNLAIHMNREVNRGVAIEAQKVLLPILGIAQEGDGDVFLQVLAEELDCQVADILDYDLYTFPYQKASLVGLHNEFILSPRLDNLLSTHAAISAFEKLSEADSFEGLCFLAISDNEEIGSRTKQGAGSAQLRQLWDWVLESLGADQSLNLKLLQEAYLLSSDLAHAVHPHHTELSDLNNRPRINEGPVLKLAANQSYCTDAESAAIFKQLCEKAQVPYQYFVNRSDMRGGSTIGPISSALMPVRCADIGMAIWGMHSACETGGCKDILHLEQLLELYFSKL